MAFTLLATAETLEDAQAHTQTYLAMHPEASTYVGMADFHVWVLHLTEARFVNGFGDMGWLSGDRLHAAMGVVPSDRSSLSPP